MLLSTTPSELSGKTERPLGPPLRYLDPALTLLVIVRCAWVFSLPLRAHDAPLRFAQDDFFYYLKAAQNLAWFHRSTLDGVTLTNGYHPLYFLLLTGVSLFVHTLPGVFRFLWALDTVSAAAIFLLSRRLVALLCSPLLANALAVLITSLCMTQICDQMEVTLAIPFGIAFLLASFVSPRQLTPRRAAAMGILGALTFLSRLDAGLLVFLVILGMLCTRAYRSALTPRTAFAFTAACAPLPLLYFGVNHFFFHTLLPVSGMAKEMRVGHQPSLLLPRSFSGTSEMLVNLAVATAVVAWMMRRRLLARERVLLFATLLTPFLFYGIEMLVSDWQVWNWYFYVLRFSALGTAVLLAIVVTRSLVPARYPRLQTLLESRAFAASFCVLVLLKLFVANYRVDSVMVEIQSAANILSRFEKQHPGVYAMGDRAGMFSMLSRSPVLQAEGLMMDRPYLEHIRNQEDLRSVLYGYGVNYYVAFVFDRNAKEQFRGSCLHALEPSIAGPSTLRMRSTLCQAPVLQFHGDDGTYVVYEITPAGDQPVQLF